MRSDEAISQLRHAIRVRKYSRRTERAYVGWVEKFIRYHLERKSETIGAAGVTRYLNDLVVRGHVSTGTHRQALCAIVFFYKHVLGRDPGEFKDLARPKRRRRMPTVLSQEEAVRLLGCMRGRYHLMGGLLYGSGLRLMECLRLRVKDLDFERGTVTVQDGKGGKSRVVPLATSLGEGLKKHLVAVRRTHMRDLAMGRGAVELPDALHRKYPQADRQWVWQYVFPAHKFSRCPKTGRIGRHHVYETTLQRHVKRAAQAAKIQKRVSCHTLRHSFATHMIENGYDIRRVQDLMGHKSIQTTMVYIHVVEAARGVRSPLDEQLITKPVTRLYGNEPQYDGMGNGPLRIYGGFKP